jgi:hypothetical protein
VKCSGEIGKWSPNVPIPACAELKYSNKRKISDEENSEDESR